MVHPEKLASLGTVDTGRRQTTLNTKQNTKNSNTALNNTTVIESYLLANILPLPLYKKPAGDYVVEYNIVYIYIFRGAWPLIIYVTNV
jgi:hypothetical protein